MAVRPCLDCGRLIAKGYRCPTCQQRQGDPGGQRKSSQWKRLRRAVIVQAGDQCSECGQAEDLQVHHEPDGRLTVLCRHCHQRTF
jgi:hypothetical protein